MGSKGQRCRFLPFQCGGEKAGTWVDQLMDDACGCVQVDKRQELDETSRLVYAQRSRRGSGDLMENLQAQEQTRSRTFLSGHQQLKQSR
jgi:hypothetical protein